MRTLKLWTWLALGLSGSMLAFVGCSGGNEFEPVCEGEECSDNTDAGVTPDASQEIPDAGDADGDVTDSGNPDAADADPDADAGDPEAGPGPDCSSFDAKAHPADEPCVIDDEHAIFVSPKGNDDSGAGTKGAPYASLAKGLATAEAASKRLFVCDDGTGFDEQVEIGSFVTLEVFGGFSCGDWSYDRNRKAKLLPSEPGVAWRFEKVVDSFRLEDFHIEARDAEAPEASSIAVIVNESHGVVLERVHIKAGKGADGLPGTTPTEAVVAGPDGQSGKCLLENDLPGGPGGKLSCGVVETSGGAGGAVVSGSGQSGENGKPESPASGRGGHFSMGLNGACTQGGKGADGQIGSAGAGGTGLGSLSASGWLGAAGEAAKPGAPGQGGGGGGAALSCDVLVGDQNQVGKGSGGGGGAGGCGGKGGGGGGAGGASIALVSLDSTLTLADCELSTSNGGKGGSGAEGQLGGAGGKPGSGVANINLPANGSCAGGDGGRGGAGGKGGGGAGGHSLAVAYKGTAPTRTGGKNSLGNAGEGGEGATAATRGENGKGAVELQFP